MKDNITNPFIRLIGLKKDNHEIVYSSRSFWNTKDNNELLLITFYYLSDEFDNMYFIIDTH